MEEIEAGIEYDGIVYPIIPLEVAKSILEINGYTITPEGFRIYVCTDCHETNVKKDNRRIRVGFCDNCEHPLWNSEYDVPDNT